MRLTFRHKLTAIAGTAALAFALVIGISDFVSKRVEANLSTIQGRYLPRVELEPQLQNQFERLQRSFQDAVASQDVETLSSAAALKGAFLERVDAARDALDPAAAAALRRALEEYCAAADDVSRRLIAKETGEALLVALEGMQAKQERLAQALGRATAFDRNEMAEAFGAAAHAVAIARTFRLWISVVCLVAVVLLSMGMTRSVVRSMADLSAGFERFGKGDFEPIRVVSRDEMEDIAEQANRMAARLETLGAERKKAEERFRGLLEAAPDAMVIVDRDRIVLVNAQAEKLFGYSRDELLGQPVELLVPERLRGRHVAHRVGYFSAPDARPMGSGLELYGRHQSGIEFPIEVSLSPIDTKDGLLVSSAIRDITTRKHAETALRTSNRELEAFSYSVAHDLRAPLRGIHGFSHLLLEDYGDKLDGEAKDLLDRIRASVERMAELIDALLSLSRVTRTEFRREPVNLSQIADAVMSQLRASHPGRRVDFDNQPEVIAHGDARLLRLLLANLLENAWKFTSTRAAARIAFGFKWKEGTTVYYVQDNGAGFDMAYREKLFAPFQRLHGVHEFPGTGIGLATVHRIVSRHGGRIWADGIVAQGATFFFTLEERPVPSDEPRA
jgi:PAS domain S-box-containing protein